MKISLRSATLLLVLACAPFSNVRAEETPLNDDGIRLLIKDLGSEDFEKRQGAEKKLAAQGLKAEALLKATVETTTDAQVRATAARLLGKLKLASLASVDYLTVFPADSVAFLQVRNLADSIEKSKGTAVGKCNLLGTIRPTILHQLSPLGIDAIHYSKPTVKVIEHLGFPSGGQRAICLGPRVLGPGSPFFVVGHLHPQKQKGRATRSFRSGDARPRFFQ